MYASGSPANVLKLLEVVRGARTAPDVLKTAIKKTGFDIAQLRYLPLTSSKTTEWIVLLDTQLNIVGYAPVDGF